MALYTSLIFSRDRCRLLILDSSSRVANRGESSGSGERRFNAPYARQWAIGSDGIAVRSRVLVSLGAGTVWIMAVAAFNMPIAAQVRGAFREIGIEGAMGLAGDTLFAGGNGHMVGLAKLPLDIRRTVADYTDNALGGVGVAHVAGFLLCRLPPAFWGTDAIGAFFKQMFGPLDSMGIVTVQAGVFPYRTGFTEIITGFILLIGGK